MFKSKPNIYKMLEALLENQKIEESCNPDFVKMRKNISLCIEECSLSKDQFWAEFSNKLKKNYKIYIREEELFNLEKAYSKKLKEQTFKIGRTLFDATIRLMPDCHEKAKWLFDYRIGLQKLFITSSPSYQKELLKLIELCELEVDRLVLMSEVQDQQTSASTQLGELPPGGMPDPAAPGPEELSYYFHHENREHAPKIEAYLRENYPNAKGKTLAAICFGLKSAGLMPNPYSGAGTQTGLFNAICNILKGNNGKRQGFSAHLSYYNSLAIEDPEVTALSNKFSALLKSSN